MFTYKKYIFLFFISIATALTATAQGSIEQQAAQLSKLSARRSVSHALADRVQRTYLYARITQWALASTNETSSLIHFSLPANRMKPRLHANPHELYPQAPFLANRKQLSDYFLSLNNRKIVPVLKAQQQHRENVQQHLNDLKKGRRSILEGEEMKWFQYPYKSGSDS